MFGLISRKQLKAELKKVLKNNQADICSKEEFYYNCGNANAVNYLSHRFKIDVTDEEKFRRRFVK